MPDTWLRLGGVGVCTAIASPLRPIRVVHIWLDLFLFHLGCSRIRFHYLSSTTQFNLDVKRGKVENLNPSEKTEEQTNVVDGLDEL